MRHLGLLLLLALLTACECGIAPPPPPPPDPVGQIGASLAEGGFEIALVSLERPIRSLQVDVKLQGARANSVRALNGADITEAALSQPKDDFTVVVSDTRRLPLPPGPTAFVYTDVAPSSITLVHAFAVDDLGAKRTITVVTP